MKRFSSVVLVDARGWVLLQERDEHPVIDPERWGYPGGHVDDGETFERAAHRELGEETGLDAGLELYGRFEAHHGGTGQVHEITLWAGRTDATDADVVCGEGRQIVFVDPDAAVRLALTESAAATLPAFLDSDLYRRLRNGARA